MSPGAVTEILHLYTAEVSEKIGAGGGLVSEGEEIELFEIPFVDALKMIKNGEIIDAKTICLLQHLALERVLNTKP